MARRLFNVPFAAVSVDVADGALPVPLRTVAQDVRADRHAQGIPDLTRWLADRGEAAPAGDAGDPAAGFGACLAAPLNDPLGGLAGVLVVADRVPRIWSADDTAALADIAATTEAVIAGEFWKRSAEHSAAALKPSELAGAEILDRMGEGFYTIDRDWRITYVNPAAERFWHISRDRLLGHTMFELFPRFRESEPWQAHERAFAEGKPQQVETHSTATGAPIALNVFPTREGLSVHFRDLTGWRQLERQLRDRDEILSLAEQAAGIGVWDADLTAQTLRGTPEFFRLLGLEPSSEPVSMEITRAVRHPDDRDRVLNGFLRAMTSGHDTYEAEYRIIRPDGELRWIFGRGRVIRDAAGTPVRYAGIDIDTTERKRQDEQIRIVMRELVHRTNNMLAVIQAMARQTAVTSVGLRDFEQRFSARLRGLAHSNEVLVRQDWRGGAVDALIQTQLAPFVESEAGRLALDGPHVMLCPEAVQNIGLALHELATNASKYGALSRAGGRILISWNVENPGSEEAVFRLTWREEGGPPVKAPRRKGFGRFVVEMMVARALHADVNVDFAPAGLQWTIGVPVSQALANGKRT